MPMPPPPLYCSQLPSDMDVEDMVVASYEVVLNHRLNQSEHPQEA